MDDQAALSATTRTLIVNYHYCLTADENRFLARTAVAPEEFRRQMEAVAGAARSGELQYLVTFDDGTKDIYRNAVPIIKALGIPAILFICSQPILEGRLLNVTKIHLLQGKLGLEAFRSRFMSSLQEIGYYGPFDEPEQIGLAPMYRYDELPTREFKLLLNVRLPSDVATDLLDRLFESEFGSQQEAARALYMSLDDIQRCCDIGVTIGMHTHSHTMLTKMPAERQEREIRYTLELFHDRLGLDSAPLSYPFGVPGTWNATTKALLQGLGVQKAFTLGREIYDPTRHPPLEIPRFDVNDVFDNQGLIKVPTS